MRDLIKESQLHINTFTHTGAMCSTLSSRIPSLLMPCWIMDQHPFLLDILQKAHPSAEHAATPQVTHDVGKASVLDGSVLTKEKR